MHLLCYLGARIRTYFCIRLRFCALGALQLLSVTLNGNGYNNSNTRHWFARFRRKSKVVSKSLEMVELTMALFARFHVNGDMDMLIRWTKSLIT
jgi:hypothetical protein